MLNVVLTGLNGYGKNYITSLLNKGENKYRLAAVVSGNPEKSEYYQELLEKKVHFYTSLEECIKNEEIDFAIICTPMHIHYKEVMCALKNKVSIYCEKPVGTTLVQTKKISEYAKMQGCRVAVGYQWSFSSAILKLKKDLMQGKYGKILNSKAYVIFNRDKRYYFNNWKGKKYSADNEPIFENVLSNCGSHSLHNLLFLQGKTLNTSIMPKKISGNAYRTHNIETFDTITLNMELENNSYLTYAATTVGDKVYNLGFELKCEKGTIKYVTDEEKCIYGILKDGTEIKYGSPDDKRFEHFEETIECVLNDTKIPCTPDTVIPLEYVMDYVNDFEIIDMKDNIIEDEINIKIDGLSDKLMEYYKNS